MEQLQITSVQVLILLGPPGSGKGSQALLLKEAKQIAHISTGDLLRNHIKENTPLGSQAQEFMNRGLLVPDPLVFEMLFNRLEAVDCQRGFILDGFPRTLLQAQILEKRLGEGHQIFALDLSIDDEIIIDRLTQRRTCSLCQAPYHIIHAKPKIGNRCDLCGGTLQQRSDDQREIIEKRLSIYRENTKPLIDYYGERGVLYKIDSSQAKDQVLAAILVAIV